MENPQRPRHAKRSCSYSFIHLLCLPNERAAINWSTVYVPLAHSTEADDSCSLPHVPCLTACDWRSHSGRLMVCGLAPFVWGMADRSNTARVTGCKVHCPKGTLPKRHTRIKHYLIQTPYLLVQMTLCSSIGLWFKRGWVSIILKAYTYL